MSKDYHRGKFVGAWLSQEEVKRIDALPGTTMREKIVYLLNTEPASEEPLEVAFRVADEGVRGDVQRLLRRIGKRNQVEGWNLQA